MATIRRKKAEPFSILQRDPGPWPTLLINWMATLGIIVIFGLVMLFSASYTTGYLRFGDSLHFIRSQVLCLGLGVVATLRSASGAAARRPPSKSSCRGRSPPVPH